MGDIGKVKRKIEIIPERELEPSEAPVQEPSPETAPAAPVPASEPVPS